MLSKILTVTVAFVLLVVGNNFLIDPLWGELVFTALVAGAMTYVLGRLGSGTSGRRP